MLQFTECNIFMVLSHMATRKNIDHTPDLRAAAKLRTFAERLHYLRKIHHGMNQNELALELGVSQSTIANYEMGNRRISPSAQIVSRLAVFFGVNSDWLINGTLPILPEKNYVSPEIAVRDALFKSLTKKENNALIALNGRQRKELTAQIKAYLKDV